MATQEKPTTQELRYFYLAYLDGRGHTVFLIVMGSRDIQDVRNRLHRAIWSRYTTNEVEKRDSDILTERISRDGISAYWPALKLRDGKVKDSNLYSVSFSPDETLKAKKLVRDAHIVEIVDTMPREFVDVLNTNDRRIFAVETQRDIDIADR